jgi:hypothetical protein
MELSELIPDKTCIKDLIPNPKGGEGLTVSFSPDAITPRSRREIMAMQATDDEADAVMTMIELFDIEWNLTKNGVQVVPVRDITATMKAEIDQAAIAAGVDPVYPPTLRDVYLKSLMAVLTGIVEHTRPKDQSIEAL